MDHGAEQEALGQVKSQSILIFKNYIYWEARVKQMASDRRIT